jgi:hypothetical protein
MGAAILALNFIGDGLRDALDPGSEARLKAPLDRPRRQSR